MYIHTYIGRDAPRAVCSSMFICVHVSIYTIYIHIRANPLIYIIYIKHTQAVVPLALGLRDASDYPEFDAAEESRAMM
jgi:hypothetical protein